MTTRREFLALAAAALVDVQTSFASGAVNGQDIHLGAQTNAWPIAAANLDSFLGILDQIRLTGYTGFETGYLNLTHHADRAGEVKQRIAATGLTFFALHLAIPFEKCDPETFLPPESLYKPTAELALAFGAKHLVLSGAPAKSAEQVKQKAAGLFRAADFGASLGLPVLYHNHDWEFTSAFHEMDLLFSETNNTPVRFLLDAYHAGSDVLGFTSTHLARIAAFHMRDYANGKQVPLGQGNFPLASFAALLQSRGWSGWLLNEEDSDGKEKMGLAVISPAYKALEAAFIKGISH
jgi:sugar phosphate isomerase/epimerase